MGRQFGAALLLFVAAAIPPADPDMAGTPVSAVLHGDPANGKFICTGACTVCRGANGKGGTRGGATAGS